MDSWRPISYNECSIAPSKNRLYDTINKKWFEPYNQDLSTFACQIFRAKEKNDISEITFQILKYTSEIITRIDPSQIYLARQITDRLSQLLKLGLLNKK